MQVESFVHTNFIHTFELPELETNVNLPRLLQDTVTFCKIVVRSCTIYCFLQSFCENKSARRNQKRLIKPKEPSSRSYVILRLILESKQLGSLNS